MDQTNGGAPGFRLSVQQEHLLAPGTPVPVTQCAVSLRGPLDPAALRVALQARVADHEILRTTLVQRPGIRLPEQVVHAELAPAWTAQREQGESLRSVLSDEARLGFDLQPGPLLRVRLIEAAEDLWTLVLSAPAALLDAPSLLTLLGELSGHLAGDRGAAANAPEPVQHADYAEWRSELLTGDDAIAVPGRGFWRAAGAEPPPAVRLPFARPQREGTGRFESVAMPIDAELRAAVGTAAQSARIGEDVFLEACWHALLARLSGAAELSIAGYVDGRAQPDLNNAVGPYAQVIPVRTRFEEGTSLAEVLDQVRRARADGTRWQDFASAEDLDALTRTAGIGFAYLPDADLAPLGAAAVELLALSAPLGGVWLQCGIRSHRDGLEVQLHYDPEVIASEDVESLVARYGTLLAGAAADPLQAADALIVVGPDERDRLLAEAQGPQPGAAAPSPQQRFEEQAERFPERLAVRSAAGDLTYAELDSAANRLAAHLRGLGVGRDVVVGLALERVPEMVIALLAVLKAGGAYLPLNFEHPAERLAHQLTECSAPVLLTQEHLLERLPAFAGHTVCLDRDAGAIAGQSAQRPERVSQPQDLAYVIYTSGSTGLPKGVAVTQANLAGYTAHMVDQLGLDGPGYAEGPQAAVISSISTDLGNTTIFPTLAAGGALHLISPQASMDPDAFAAETAAAPLDVLKITPSHLHALLSDSGGQLIPRRWLILGGEALPWDLVALIGAQPTGCRILNHYGPTETTIGCCTFELDGQASRDDAATVPIGRPITGARAYVLDRAREPVPAGVQGELWIGGAGVARGYVGRPEETAERFPPDPFAAGSGQRMYRTGDRVRRLRDGTIEFLGRIDHQLKIRGYRVEPGEVEAALSAHPAVKQAAVVALADARGPRLVAHYVAPAEPTDQELAGFLARSLPEYMIPGAFIRTDALPLSPSGKVDRMALLEVQEDGTRREDEHVAPRDALEQEIAEIWGELLGVERVGVRDDFFALGGHSLLATQAIMRIRRVHGDIPLHALLGAPTVEALAEVVRASAEDRVWQNAGTSQA